MEHIVQFGISIDDEVIKKTIMNQAVNEMKKIIREDISREMSGSEYGSWQYNNKIREFAKEVTQNFLEDNKDEIIEKTTDKLAEKLVKTKAVKQAVEDMMAKI